MTEKAGKLLAVCKPTIGIEESPRGSNNGKALRELLTGTGFVPGQPWCNYYTAAMGRRAFGSFWPLPVTGSCDVTLAFARKNKILRHDPEPGFQFLVMASANDAVHTGFVGTDVSDDAFSTIEGNSNGGGGREGFCVVNRKARAIDPAGRYWCAFVDWEKLMLMGEDTGTAPDMPTPNYSEGAFAIKIGQKVAPGRRVVIGGEGRVYVSVRSALLALFDGATVSSDLILGDNGLLCWQDRLVPGQHIYRDGSAFVWVRDFAKFMRLVVTEVDMASGTLRLTRSVA
jgi:hypothetical protein